MAVYKADILDIELNTGNIARSFLCHNIGKDDTKADRFGVRVYRDGEPESLSGCSIQGYMMRPNGTNLAITGSNTGVSGNEAWVDLPQAAYDYEGQFCLALKLIGGGVTGTVRIIDGMINNTFVSDAVAPTAAVPTYQEILSVYDQMVAAKAGSVRFDTDQTLTAAQMIQARGNIEAASESDVNDLKSALTANINQTDGRTVSDSKDSSGGKRIEYYFLVGHTYIFKNTSESTAIGAWTQNVPGTNIDTITSGMDGGNSKSFTATVDAKYLYVYGDAAFSFSIVESSSVGYKVDHEIADDINTIENQYNALVDKAYMQHDVFTDEAFTLNNNCYVSATTTSLQLQDNNQYKTYWMILDKETNIYLELSSSISFLDLGVLQNASGNWVQHAGGYSDMTGTDGVRYRKSENNLPTSQSPLTLPANTLICISSTKATSSGVYVYMDDGIKLSEDVQLSLAQSLGYSTVKAMSQKAVTDAIVDASEYTHIQITKNSNTNYLIEMNGYSIPFKYYDYNGLRMHCWNIAEGITKNGETVVPSGTDIIGVLQESGASDFMGGVHGDETNVYMKMYADGVEVTESTQCKKLDIIMYSHLTQVSTGDNIIDRFVHMAFENGGIIIENTFKCLIDGFALSVAYNGGLFAWYADDSNTIWLNDRYYDAENPDSIYLTPTLKSAYVELDNGASFAVENLYGFGTERYKGGLSYFSSETPKRLKMYYANDSSNTWNTGHVCYGKFKYSLR